MAWTNSDGLYIKFGTEEATVGTAGEYAVMMGPEHMTEVVISLTSLAATAARQNEHTIIPSGVRITKVKVINEVTATTGSTSTLNVGLQRLDRSTELDYDGLLVAAPLSDYNLVGETKEYIIGVTGVGALVGTTTTNPGYITADYDTDAFTAGKVRVQIFWYKP